MNVAMVPNVSFLIVLSLLVLQVPPVTGQQLNNLGEGFFTPKTDVVETLYLYDIPNSRQNRQPKPVDSITFVKRYAAHVDAIGYAPDNFMPFKEKLDYGVFLIKVKRLGRDYHEIIINEETGKTAYVSALQGDFISWGQFFLNCHSVEFIDNNQKVFDNPMIKSAGRVVSPANFRVRYVMGDWMEVEILAGDYNTVKRKGWIRWRKDGKLLVNYNLFA
ncbi:hypothetical protein [Marixanthomonas spongiae]|uniref:Uncharacterized protein n=1 Tax=Marixanthomonas spongiae TaxID=2174845 RepID=A0A2U0I416_9FLAO|nr:hypothetical protein [Marixanthomonas spongiae]PVW15730.1 hypothetical protein DDV96_05535 [Marixanthomonas spongiae]